jgi:hypothetical protein
MIELRNDELVFSFPEVHESAVLRVSFQRTLRIPDDGRDYPLPPGLGRFPLRHVDDYARRVPSRWLSHGGVMLPMYQSEALWLAFSAEHVPGRDARYPFAIKVAAGRINAVTGEPWANELVKSPQDYLVAPEQPWLDGYCVERGLIRQFVAMPLGEGWSVEEQLTGEAAHGGLRILVCPMKREVFERRFPEVPEGIAWLDAGMPCAAPASAPDMGLAAGGRMRQEIYEDPFDFADWDRAARSRCFVHIADSATWCGITGDRPPTRPPSARDYSRIGLPWFEYYDADAEALDGAARLGEVKSIAEIAREKGLDPDPEDAPVTPEVVLEIRSRLGKDQVREDRF